MSTDPAELPFLLLGAFRTLVDEMHEELAMKGHPGARPSHGFALQAIGPDGARLSELASRLGVSKQAVTKTIAALETHGYAERYPDVDDARATLVRRSPRGEEMLNISATALRRAHRRLARDVGSRELAVTLRTLEVLAGEAPIAAIPAWLA